MSEPKRVNNDHDPRNHPQPGDSLFKVSGGALRVNQRTIVSVEGDLVVYKKGLKECRCDINAWRKWACDARVVKKP